ncbi:T9SS type A sorting domain-containing protein [Chryseobacterium mucoviscidosis]|uniref:T9SS type A sorting domain-containing protein n=1 Tax=Chryseobacterium mucoviscidosis TaxID=1945581 RepID=UPI00301AB40E
MFQKILSVIAFSFFNLIFSQQYSWNTQGITVAGGNGAGGANNQLNFPYSVFIDSSSNLYITDTQNHRIVKWDSALNQGVTVAGVNGSGGNSNQLNTPTCVWVDDNKNIYVLDSFNARIQKWEPNAVTGITVAGGNGEGAALNQLNKPGGFYLRGNTFYIVDAGNSRIVKWAIGDYSGTLAAAGTYGANADQLANPSVNGTIYVDNNENLYVTDYINNRVQKFSSGSTNAVTVAGGNGSGTANNQMKAPNGIFMMNDGTMIIAEYTGRRILSWKEGQTSGNVIAGGNGNGSGADQFKSPRGVFVAPNGDLYVTDMGNHRIQKFIFNGTLSTQDEIKHTVSSSIYPNPADEVIHITAKYQIESIKIFDGSGRDVTGNNSVKNNSVLTVQSLEPGVYFLHLFGKKEHETLKFIKK